MYTHTQTRERERKKKMEQIATTKNNKKYE